MEEVSFDSVYSRPEPIEVVQKSVDSLMDGATVLPVVTDDGLFYTFQICIDVRYGRHHVFGTAKASTNAITVLIVVVQHLFQSPHHMEYRFKGLDARPLATNFF